MMKQQWFLLAAVLSTLSTLCYYSMHTYSLIHLPVKCDCNSPISKRCVTMCRRNLKYYKDMVRLSAGDENAQVKYAEVGNASHNLDIYVAQNLLRVKEATATVSPVTLNNTTTDKAENTSMRCDEVLMPNSVHCDACLQGRQLVTAQKGGICGGTRLGNKMFMLLPAISAAYQYNITLVLYKRSEDCKWIDKLLELFEYLNTSIPSLPVSMTKDWYNFGESGFTDYSSKNFKAGDNYTFSGYRQNWHYFSTENERREVRKVFKLSPKYNSYAQQSISRAREKHSNITNPHIVGVHMRIGDLRGNNYGYQIAPKEYYEEAMRQIYLDLNSQNIIFIVASDTLSDAKEMLKGLNSSLNIYYSTGSAFEDFATLSKCSHSIISGGTYGFWTAWLAGGKTYYPVNFAKPGSKFAEGFKNENFYMPEWTPLYVPEQTTPNTTDVVLPYNETCNGCLSGKQLVSVQKGWLCSSPRLGQKMFMLAPAIAATTSHNTTLVFYQPSADCDWIERLQDVFEQFNQIPLLSYSVTKKWANLGETISSSYSNKSLHVPEKNYTFSGYRHNWRYVKTPSELKAIRKAFRLSKKYEIVAKNTMSKVRQEFSNISNPLIVGVHVRIGDLHQQEKINYGYRMANTYFYQAAFNRASQTFKNRSMIFLVASDTMDEAKSLLGNLKASHNLYFVNGSAFEDFAVLSKCDHMIVSGGAFGYWAALLTGGKVFYYPEFARTGSEFATIFDNKDFFRPDWIPVIDADISQLT